MNDLAKFIKKNQTERRIQILNEEATKQSIILPILQFLGWEVFNIDEVFPEYSIESTRVDYALKNGKMNKVFIEVKKINEDLEKHQEQLLSYSFKHGVNLSILTNGILWWFYLPLQEGSWEQRKFYTIDIYSQEFERIADVFGDFLAKDKVLNGEALKNAKRIFSDRQKDDVINRNIPEAWKRLQMEGDEILIELLAEKTENICGYKPENKLVAEFLYSFANQGQSFFTPIKPKKRSKSGSAKLIFNDDPSSNLNLHSLDDNFTYKKIIGFVFLSQNVSVTSWRQLLLKFIDKIWITQNLDFDIITNVSGKKRPYFTKNENELRNPSKIVNSEYFVETNLSANNVVQIIKDVLTLFKYEISDLKIKLGNN